MKVFDGLDEVRAAAGTKLGPTEWMVIGQSQIDQFADATDDHQWIHTEPERAADGPFGSTIAHGYLTLSLIPQFLQSLYRVEGVKLSVNYGLNKVRFPSPVPVDSKLRAAAEIASVEEVAGGVQVVTRTTIEREGGDKPVCVAETIVRNYA